VTEQNSSIEADADSESSADVQASDDADQGLETKPVSGLYERTTESNDSSVSGEPPEELRLDVDGIQPQQVASGTHRPAPQKLVHWIAKLVAGGTDQWTGTFWYKHGDADAFPYTGIEIRALRSESSAPERLTVVFSGPASLKAEQTYRRKSDYFHTVHFEFDHVEGVVPVAEVSTNAHPNFPVTLGAEKLTVPRVFQKAGFDVQTSPGDSVPLAGAGPNTRWSNMELHDAMQRYWSRFDHRAQWAMWVLYATMHEEGLRLGGIMFDDIGPHQRQGTAIFANSFISRRPPSDSTKSAWVERMQFWCACHEMGHAFSLAHAWEKAARTPWMPLVNNPESRSFMNYPEKVQGGQQAFFANFHYQFSNEELLFMRHAPEKFVQMGNANWYDHNAFRDAKVLPEPTFKLELRSQRQVEGASQLVPRYEFMEPVILEMKLENVSGQTQHIPEKLLTANHHLTLIVKRNDQPARQIHPYATFCWHGETISLAPREAVYESLFPSVGRGGWGIAEPGRYTIQIAIQIGDEDVVSNALAIEVAPPQHAEDERIAKDFFTDAIGRILTFDGSHVLDRGNAALQEIIGRLPDRKVAIHARLAQASAVMREYKEVDILANRNEMQSATLAGGKITTKEPQLDLAKALLHDVIQSPAQAAESIGNIDLNYYLTRLARAFHESGEREQALKLLDALTAGLATRRVGSWVLRQVKGLRKRIQAK
jgi:hypothetical protein